MTREAVLEKLLTELFAEPAELRRWLSKHEFTVAVLEELPSEQAAKADVVHRAVNVIVCRNLVPELLAALSADSRFSRREGDILQVAALWGPIRQETATRREQKKPRWRLPRRLLAALLLAALGSGIWSLWPETTDTGSRVANSGDLLVKPENLLHQSVDPEDPDFSVVERTISGANTLDDKTGALRFVSIGSCGAGDIYVFSVTGNIRLLCQIEVDARGLSTPHRASVPYYLDMNWGALIVRYLPDEGREEHFSVGEHAEFKCPRNGRLDMAINSRSGPKICDSFEVSIKFMQRQSAEQIERRL